MYVDRGIDRDLANQRRLNQAGEAVQRSPALVGTPVRSLGVDPDKNDQSWQQSVWSFAVGAALPVVPYLLGADALWPALIVSLGGTLRRRGDSLCHDSRLVVRRHPPAGARRSGRSADLPHR